MANVQLSPEEQAILDGLPEAQPSEEQQPSAPDQGIIGGALNWLGITKPSEPVAPEAAQAEMIRKETERAAIKDDRNSGVLGTINSVLGVPTDAVAGTIGGGALKSVFETKDFLFGDTPASEQSDFRYNVEQDVKDDTEASMLNGVAAGIGQFAAGMFGAGKLLGPMKWAGKAGEVGKAALAGAVAFDPYEARLSNLIQGTFLANPVNAWLSAQDDDGALEGRLKNAMESIGMDTTLGATFLIAGKIYKTVKGLRKGGDEEVARLTQEFEDMQAKQLEDEANAQVENTPDVNGGAPGEPVPEGYLRVDPEGGLSRDQGGTPPAGRADDLGDTGAPSSGPAGLDTGAPPQGKGALDAADEAQPLAAAGRAPRVAANLNEGGASTYTPEGGPASVNVKVQPKILNPVDPNSNGFGVPLRPQRNQNPTPAIRFSDENTKQVISKSVMDVEAIDGQGGFYEAMASGHKFGDALNEVPYHKFTTQTEVDNFIARAVDTVREELDDLKGGVAMTDARVDQTVKRMVNLTGADPGFILGKIQQSGRLSAQLVADMETGFVLAQKAFIDVTGLNHRYQIGDHTGYANADAHWQDIMHRLSVAGSFYGAARSIMANSGRTMRRMRREFMFDPGKYKDVDPGRMSQLISMANGNPGAIKKLVDPRTKMQMLGDTIQFIRLAGMISGPATQIINATTSAYAALFRPVERLMGAALLSPFKSDALGQMGKDMRQFHAMGGNLLNSFKDAGQVFLSNDSKLAPHTNEYTRFNQAPGAQPLGRDFFRYKDITQPGDAGINNLVYNLLSVAGGAASVPTRALGAVDELIKQNVYKSHVQSRAGYRAAQEAAERGLTGKARTEYIKSEVRMAMDNAFDSEGRGTDPVALREAQTATFQQDLGATGKKIQGLANANWMTKFVFPFVKTPINIVKMGARLTPALGALQKELRDDLMGINGVERQAQAMGQQGMGALYTSAAAYLVMNGMFTGGGPSDPKARRELTETGWRPYAFVKTDPETGKKSYYSMSRFDPVVMPMGIAADVIDHLVQTEWDGEDDTMSSIAQSALAAVGIAAGKQFINKSYMMGASQFLNAVLDPQNKGEYWANGAAQTLVPFSGASRQFDQDPYMKDVIGIWDNLNAVTPGARDGLPHRRDWLGEKVGAPGLSGTLGFTEGKNDPIDIEAQRIALELGTGFGKADYNMNGLNGGPPVDLRTIKLDSGLTAYERLQDLTSNPRYSGKGLTLRAALNNLVESNAYQKLPDGPASQEGSKGSRIAQTLSKYRKAALQRLIKDEPQVKDAFKTSTDKAADRFREVRGVPRRTTDDQNTVQHLLDAFGADDQ